MRPTIKEKRPSSQYIFLNTKHSCNVCFVDGPFEGLFVIRK
jgi:hypothetical protein